MKYKLLRFSLLSIMAMLWGTVFADEVTMAYSGSTTANMTGENDAALLGLDATAWSVIGEKGGNSNFPGLNKAGDFRLYYDSKGGNTITVESLTGATINNIAITFTGADYSNVSVTVDGNAVNGTDGTYAIGASKFVLGNANTSNVQVRIKSVVINYGAGGQVDTRVATTLTLGDYATTGEVGGTLDLPTATVTANGSAIANAQVTWTSSNETVATISGSTINLLTAGTTTIKAEYAGDATNYKASSASFTLKVTPAAVTIANFQELQAKVTGTDTPAKITFNGEKVVFVNGSNAFLADANGLGALIYTKDHGLEAGQTLTGTIDASITLYQGNAEITNFTKEGLTIGTTAITPTATTLSNISNANQSTLVTLKNLTYNASDKLLSDGANTITFYDKFKTSVALEDGKSYDVTGVVIMYNDKIEIAPRTADDIVEATTGDEEGAWRDFAVQLTNTDVFNTSVNNFGVKVAEDGTYTAVAADDATANFTVSSSRFNDAQHGWVNCTFTVPVQGTVKIELGDCQFGGQNGTITDAAGNKTDIKANATKKCWSPNAPHENALPICDEHRPVRDSQRGYTDLRRG